MFTAYIEAVLEDLLSPLVLRVRGEGLPHCSIGSGRALEHSAYSPSQGKTSARRLYTYLAAAEAR